MAETLRKSHEEDASRWRAQADELAREAQNDMSREYTLAASDEAFEAWRACERAKYHTALAQNVRGVVYDEASDVVSGLPPALMEQDPKFQEIRLVTDRVQRIKEEIHSKSISEKVRTEVRE